MRRDILIGVAKLPDLLPAAVRAAAAAETVFWSGAGISADPPTCAPMGNKLVERALKRGFMPGTTATIERYYRLLRTTAQTAAAGDGARRRQPHPRRKRPPRPA